MQDVSGRTAFVTGGASGMGLGMARAFLEAGMNVVIADIRRDALDEAVGQLGHARVHPFVLDVTDREAWAKVADAVQARVGNVHVLALNAGVGVSGPMSTATFKDWDFNLSVNVGGVVNGLVTLLPRMQRHGEEGHIVATSSTGGFSAVGTAGLYCTAKFAVAGMMESLATELDGTLLGASVFFLGPVLTRPDYRKNDVAVRASSGAGGPPPVDTSVFMSPEEAGRRVLRGIRRGDLFIMTHPEFRRGIEARNAALLRAVPIEPPNEARAAVVARFGTLIYNPIYDQQRVVDGPDL
jgi:NADP-dependent 3-hydroxy acid dehydrogenase YdfG